MANQSLFDRLKHLFSTNVVIRNLQGKELKVTDTDRIQSFSDLNTNFMKSRGLSGFHSSVGRYGYNELSTMGMQRTVLFRDYDLMENDPIIASALDIMADECVTGDTVIPLLDGTKKMIKELYDNKCEKFWIYSLNEKTNEFVPDICHAVKYNGKKKMYNLKFDDGTSIKCTANHIWMVNGKLTYTSDLKINDSFLAIPTKISDNKFMSGYEMLYENGKWEYTHRLVAKRNLELIEQKNIVKLKSNDLVLHHNSFNKKNNIPTKLTWVEYSQHRLIHSKYNKEMWLNPENVLKYIDEYISKLIEGYGRSKLSKYFNILKTYIIKINKNLCNRFGYNSIKEFKFNDITIPKLKNELMKLSKLGLNPIRNIKILSNKLGLTTSQLIYFLNKNGYKNFNDLYTSMNNHRLVSIEYAGEDDAYDLLNAGKSHIYAIEANDGSKLFCHNSCVKNEFGDVLTIKTDDDKIKQVLHNLFYDILNIEFNIWPWMRTMPVKWNTYIPLLSGENITIEELSNRIKANKQELVYSIQDITNRVVPGKVIWCDKNVSENKIVKIIFNDDSYVETAPSHPFILKNGKEVRADMLNVNDELMSFYKHHDIVKNVSKCEVNLDNYIKHIKSIEITEDDSDVYCMTVVGLNGEQDRHNFAVCGKDTNENIIENSGVFVKNCKYGDMFLKLEISENFGIVNVIPVSPYEITREEGFDQDNPFKVRFQYEGLLSGRREYDNYEIAHFRLLTDQNFSPYGKSAIESARRVWKQLWLMQDAMLIHRIMRAPEKRIFKIDTGNIAPHESEQYIKSMINKIKKVPYVDPRTGEYNLKYNMMNMTEDFFIPVRGGDSGTDISSLPGLEYNAIDDIEYLKNMMLAALKIPKAFLGYDEGIAKCIALDTEIPLINGTTKTLMQLIDDYNNNIINYVYSINLDTNEVVCGEIEVAQITRKNTQVVKVWLDNGKYIICTPDHKFMNRDGQYVEAKDLKENDSLMPLYLGVTTEKSRPGYTTVYDIATNKYKVVHTMVVKDYNLMLSDKNVVHHRDFNKLNNYPTNLDCSMNYWEHRKYHTNIRKGMKSGNMETCTVCNKQFYVFPYRTDSAKYCSYSCYHTDLKTGHITRCERCDVEFYSEQNKNRKYCSTNCSNIDTNATRFKNCKHNSITLEDLILFAKECDSFKKLKSKLNIFDIKTLYKVFNKFNVNILNFINEYMPLAKNNARFYNKYKYRLNRTVVKVEILEETIDTGNLSVAKYHNFATSAGVFIKNSGLAAEDVRFARTIERFQKIFVSELTKIAVIHLYAQGFKDADIVNFDLSLTNPSMIYEHEKVSLWQEKMSLVKDMQDTKMFSNDWIYKNILNLSENEIETQKNKVLDDVKRSFRYDQIANEGNDPYVSNQTFGTSHDIALIQKSGNLDFGKTNFKVDWNDSKKNDENLTDDPDYDKNYNKEKREPSDSKYSQDSHIRGRDPIGKNEYITSLDADSRKQSKSAFANMHREGLNFNKIKTAQIIKESLKESDIADINNDNKNIENSYLNEDNLL